MSEFPHGECECRGGGCGCEARPGPAVFVVARKGKDIKVCTKCDLSRDTNRRLLVTGDEDPGLYNDYDALGFFCVLGMLAGDIKVRREDA